VQIGRIGDRLNTNKINYGVYREEPAQCGKSLTNTVKNSKTGSFNQLILI
jgi:hypothetical protein